MYTQCPVCATVFRVRDEWLAQTEGEVRCGMCLSVFDLHRRCAAHLPPSFQPHVLTPEAGLGGAGEPDAAVAVAAPAPAVGPLGGRGRAPLGASAEADQARATAVGTDWHLATTAELEARLAPRDSARLGAADWAWALGVIVLAAALFIQLGYFQRHELAHHPGLRPWLERLCVVAACDLPLQRDLTRLRLVRSHVADHPRRDGALVATAVLVNEAPFRQPYPLLKLSLLDENQRVIGSRWFHPSDYLEDPDLRERWAAGMPSGHPVAVRLELLDPGSGSAQYILDYRN